MFTKFLFNFCFFISFPVLIPDDPLGRITTEKSIGILWVAIHKSFRLATREHNIAILGTLYPMQFHAHFYQICLPHSAYSDTNTDPIGGIKYSIRMLSIEGDKSREFTNANGRTIYSPCQDKCTKIPPNFEDIYYKREGGSEL